MSRFGSRNGSRSSGSSRDNARGEDRAGAVREWDRLRPDDALIDTMAAALQRQVVTDEWKRGIGIPYACRWISKERWKDTPRGAPAERTCLPQRRYIGTKSWTGRRSMCLSDFVSIEAEQAVLGSMLIDSRCIRDVGRVLRETDLSIAANQELFRVITTMDREGRPVDGLTVCQEALRQRLMDEKPLRKYLADLMILTPTAANVMEYAGIVASKARRRELKAALQDGIKALEDGEPEDTLIPKLDTALTASAERTASELLAPKEQVDSFFAYRERIDDGSVPYVRTGIRPLDKLLGGGMVQDGLYILAGRPGMGKSALGVAIRGGRGVHCWAGGLFFAGDEQRADHGETAIRTCQGRQQAHPDGDDDGGGKPQGRRGYSDGGADAALYHRWPGPDSGSRIAAIARASRDVKLVVVDHFGLDL